MRAIVNEPRHKLGDEEGDTLLETAVVLPVFFLVLFGLFEFSIVLWGYSSATYVSGQVARYASLHSSTSLAPCTSAFVTTIVTAQVWAPSGTVTVAPTWAPDNSVGSTVSISISIAYPIGLPLVSAVTVASSAQRTITR